MSAELETDTVTITYDTVGGVWRDKDEPSYVFYDNDTHDEAVQYAEDNSAELVQENRDLADCIDDMRRAHDVLVFALATLPGFADLPANVREAVDTAMTAQRFAYLEVEV